MKKFILPRAILLQRNIVYVGIFSFLTLLGVYIVVQQKKKAVEKTDASIVITQNEIKLIEGIGASISETEAINWNYLISNDENSKTQLKLHHTQLLVKIQEATNLTDTFVNHLGNQLLRLAKEKINFQTTVIQPNQKFLLDHNADELVFGPQVKVILSTMLNRENVLLKGRVKKSEAAISEYAETALWSKILSFILLIAILYKLNKDNSHKNIARNALRANELKYRNLIENAGVVMYTTTLDGTINFSTTKAFQLTGYSTEELTGMHISTLITPEWKKIVFEYYSKQLMHRVSESNFDFSINTKDGEIKWVEQSARLLLSIDGVPQGFQCIVKDISEKKELEKIVHNYEIQLIQSQERLQSILDHATSLIFTKDVHGKYMVVNKRFKDALGVTEEMVIGKTDFDFTSFEDASKYKEVDELIIRTGKPVETEEIVEMGNGKHHLLLAKFPLLDVMNKVYGISGIATDITERVRYQDQLIKARQIAEDAEKMQEHFLANMSHEIRTPMNGIQGMTDLLLETTLDEEQLEFAQTIKQSSDNLIVIINDILDFSKIKAGKLVIEQIDFSLTDILGNIKRIFKRRLDEKKLAFEITLTDDVPLLLSGDPYRLNQVLVNILGNAIKFTQTGKIELHVASGLSDSNGMTLHFKIKDTGIGIDPDAVSHIFQSFTQASTDITRKYGGTGLGLAITRQLLQLQGGDITVSSEPGIGSCFSFNIYYRYNTLSWSGRQIESNDAKKEALKGKSFLIAEDNEVNQKVIMQVIKKAGGYADIANNGIEAISLLKTGKKYDIIILDLQMPEMDGYSTTRYIRNEMKLQIPIIAMTASALKGEKIKCLQIGMNDYLSKPFVFREFYQSVSNILSTEPCVREKEYNLSQQQPSFMLYDLSLLEEMEDDDYTIEVLNIYLTETPAELEKLLQASIENNFQKIYSIAHKLKSSTGLLKIHQMMALLNELETDARNGAADGQLTSMVNELMSLYRKIHNPLQQQVQLLVNKQTIHN